MEKLFENLYLYEIVLLFLGIFLFVILCAGLVYYIIKKDDIKKLLLFFPIPIIMIGYPSIQEIQIEKDKIALIKYTDEVLENPEDKEAQQELLKVTEKLEKRAHSLDDIRAVSEANLVLGNSDKVIDLANQAIEKELQESDDRNSSEDPSDASNTPRINSEREAKITSLKNIQDLATVQKTIQEDPDAIKDTLLVQEKILKVSWNNPKTEAHLRRKILKTKPENR